MALELEASDFESVRKLIDINLTSDRLSDDVLTLDAYMGEAIRYVQARTSNEDADAKLAAVYRLASLLIKAVPRLSSESNAGYSYTKQQMNIEKRAEELAMLADSAIARSEALNPTEIGTAFASNMSHFDVAEAKNWTPYVITDA